jgi:glycosyltransferase involved in cell wall biosynthesis
MHILMICVAAPTPERPRAHGLLTALARCGHTVSLIFVDRAGTAFDELSDRCQTITPVRRRYGLARAVTEELARRPFDLVHLEGPLARAAGAPLPLPTVIDVTACLAARRERATRGAGTTARVAHVLRTLWARRYKLEDLAGEARLIVAATKDVWAYDALGYAARRPELVPTPLDLGRFAPQLRRCDQATLLLDLRDLGRFERMAALGAAHAIMTQAWRQRPELALNVLGAPPPGAGRQLADEPRIRLLGSPRDARPHLAAASLALVPVLPGGAAPYAPLEAMATGLPVLGLPALADELEALPGRDLATAPGPAAMAHEVLALLDDAPYRGRLGRGGRRLVELHHSYEVATAALEQVYAAATGLTIADWRLAVGLERALGA